MSVFSKILASRKAAKEHKNKVAEKEKEPAKVVYKHVPTHAAVDALSGAPSSWKHEDRPKIKEHHKRRSEMVISRTGSSLSHMSYMNAAAGSSSNIPPLPRNSSYSSYNPTWFDRGGDVYYSNENQRQKVPRSHSYHDSGIGPSIGPSPLASQLQSEGTSSNSATEQLPQSFASQLDHRLTSYVEVSPVVSSGNSTNSNSSAENLEIAHASNSKNPSNRPQPIVYAEKDIFDRLHTSTTRKVGEAPLYDSPPPSKPKTPTSTVVAQEIKPKKQRWSILGKKNTTAVV